MEIKQWSSIRRAVLLCAVTVGVSCAHATEEVIWWQVDDDPDVDTFHDGIKKASALGADEARIVTSAGDYLVIPLLDQESLGVPMDGAWYAVLPDSTEGLSFMVELGNWENGQWVGIAHSQSYTYAELANNIIQNWSGPEATPAIGGPWIAEGYAVPEPSSGILLLIGGGLLALRRKRRG